MANIDDVLANLNPKIAKKAQFASDIVVERQPLPSIGLTKALNGGLKYGAQHMFWGNRSSGKTAVALQTLGMAQKAGKSCLFVDVEGSYTPEWGEKLGIDNSKLLVVANQKTHGGVTDEVVQYLEAGIDFVLIDSISGLIPGSYFDKKNELKEFSDTNQIGQHARETGKMCITFNLKNQGNTLILLISQVTTGIYQTYTQMEAQGGKKTEHMNSSMVKMLAARAQTDQIKGIVRDGDRVTEKPIGVPVNWTIDKDRGPGINMKGKYDFYYDGDTVGIDVAGEVVGLAIDYGIIEQRGAWFFYGDDKFQGTENTIKYFKSNPEAMDQISKDILG